MNFFRLAIKNLTRHRARNIITLVSILLAVGVLFAVISYDRGFSESLERELGRTGTHITVVPTGCPHEAASLLLYGGVIPRLLNQETTEKIQEIVGDRAAGFYPMLLTQARNVDQDRLDLVYGMYRPGIRELKPNWELEQCCFPGVNEEMVVGSAIAERDGLQVGDYVTYDTKGRFVGEIEVGDTCHDHDLDEHFEVDEAVGYEQEFRVSGILKETGTQDDLSVFVPLPAAHMMVGQIEGVTAYGIRLHSPGASHEIMRELESEISGIQAVTSEEMMDTVTDVIQSARVLSFSMVVLVVVISVSGVMNTILMTVFERTKEIGTMRALGASRWDVFRMTMNEAMLLTFIGGVLGIALANFGAPFIEEFVRGFLPYVPEGRNIHFDPLIALGCLVFSMIIGAVAGSYPAWWASRIAPIEAIRN